LFRLPMFTVATTVKRYCATSGHAGSSPALGTNQIETWRLRVKPLHVDVDLDRATPKGGVVLKTLSCLLLAAMLSGCLPIGIRGTSLPNYADAPRAQVATAQAARHVV
jgi:hypothetical protein